MTGTFIDSNVFIALANKRDADHARAVELIREIAKGEFGQPYTSDYVLDETVATALFRTGRLDVAINAGKIILGSREESILPFAKMIKVGDKSFADAWTAFKGGRFRRLSFTDHTILVQVKEFKIDSVTTFDTGFDGLAQRNF